MFRLFSISKINLLIRVCVSVNFRITCFMSYFFLLRWGFVWYNEVYNSDFILVKNRLKFFHLLYLIVISCSTFNFTPNFSNTSHPNKTHSIHKYNVLNLTNTQNQCEFLLTMSMWFYCFFLCYCILNKTIFFCVCHEMKCNIFSESPSK